MSMQPSEGWQLCCKSFVILFNVKVTNVSLEMRWRDHKTILLACQISFLDTVGREPKCCF